MLKPEVLVDKLTRANERLKVISDIESYVRQVDHLKQQLESLTGESKL